VIYRSTSKSSGYKAVKTVSSGSTVSYSNSSLKAGVKYYYKVRAYRTVDGTKVYSSYSSVVSATTKLGTPTLKLTAGSKKATVKWSKVSEASGYVIYRSTKKSSGYKAIKTVKSGSTVKYVNKKLKKGKKYYYKVRAYKTVNGKKVYSSYSTVKSVKVK